MQSFYLLENYYQYFVMTPCIDRFLLREKGKKKSYIAFRRL